MSAQTVETLVVWSPYAVLGIAVLAVLLLDALGRGRAAALLACGSSAVAFGAAVWSVTLAARPGGGGALILGGWLTGSLGASAISAAIFALTFLALLAAIPRLSRQEQGGQTAALILFGSAAASVLVSTTDLAVFVIALELLTLTGFALVSASRDPRADEASVKYFVQASVATGMLLYGVAVLFGVFGGSTSYADIATALTRAGTSNAAVAAMVLVLSAVAFKLAAFPFHSWAPDAYETASAPVAAFLASAPKLAALGAGSLLLMGVFAGQQSRLIPLAAAIAVASIVFGNLAALRQSSLQRMLAYSGIAQVGYALVAFASGSRGLLLIFGFTYTVAAAGAFIFAEAVHERSEWDGSIASLAGLGAKRPVLSASLAVCLLSLTGIPLTAGFWGKVAVFGGVAVSGSPYWWLALVGVLGSVVSFGYYGGVLKAVYLDDPAGRFEEDASDSFISQDVFEAADSEPGKSALPATAAVLAAVIVLVVGIAPLVWGRLALFALTGS